MQVGGTELYPSLFENINPFQNPDEYENNMRFIRPVILFGNGIQPAASTTTSGTAKASSALTTQTAHASSSWSLSRSLPSFPPRELSSPALPPLSWQIHAQAAASASPASSVTPSSSATSASSSPGGIADLGIKHRAKN